MAESQLMVMEDGRIHAKVPESKPEFYYSEEQRAAIEQLVRNGDGAFKTRLKEDDTKDFLSAREIKLISTTFNEYTVDSDKERKQDSSSDAEADSGVHSTYWPQLSDTEVPQLDIGWPTGVFFRGVTRVAVHTHPPKDSGPHIKEVVRRLIQEATKVIAIVMDLLTDLHIIQDLMDAAWRRSVPVYILLDARGVPHFLDMFSRLQVGAHHLRNMRARSVEGTGLGLSFGKLPGSLCNKYMLVDGDKVMFGSYSFSWCTSRMDRNTIMVMSGQVLECFDRDFRELYAISDKLDLYKEFNIERPTKVAPPAPLKVGAKRPPLPATTSRFQVSLGDSGMAELKVPAHKYYNPKYALVFGDNAGHAGSLPEQIGRRERVATIVKEEMDPGRTLAANSERTDKVTQLPPAGGKGGSKKSAGVKSQLSQKFSWVKGSRKKSVDSLSASPLPSHISNKDSTTEEEDALEVRMKRPSKWRRAKSKMSLNSESMPAVNIAQDNESMVSQKTTKKPSCILS